MTELAAFDDTITPRRYQLADDEPDRFPESDDPAEANDDEFEDDDDQDETDEDELDDDRDEE